MGKIKSIYPVLAIIALTGCGLLNDNSPEALYRQFMQMDIPSNVKNFRGEGEVVFPVFMSRGYFIYEADDFYFEYISNYGGFTESNENNQPIIMQPLPQLAVDLEDSVRFLFWTKKTNLEKAISLKNKVTYVGINFPWMHYLLRDTVTNQTYHLVCGIKD